MKQIVYNYEHKDDILSDDIQKLVNKLYSYSYPKANKPFEKLAKHAEKYSQGRYHYPCDFAYLPNEVYKTIVDDFAEAHGYSQEWKDNIDYLLNILFVDGGIKEVYEPGEFDDKPYRHCIDVPTLDNIIGKENSKKVKDVITGYKNTYKFGERDYNSINFYAFSWGPCTNRNLVKEAWKTVFEKDIEIPADDTWVDEYQDEDNEQFEHVD